MEALLLAFRACSDTLIFLQDKNWHLSEISQFLHPGTSVFEKLSFIVKKTETFTLRLDSFSFMIISGYNVTVLFRYDMELLKRTIIGLSITKVAYQEGIILCNSQKGVMSCISFLF